MTKKNGRRATNLESTTFLGEIELFIILQILLFFSASKAPRNEPKEEFFDAWDTPRGGEINESRKARMTTKTTGVPVVNTPKGSASAADEEAVKKFGKAKAISSDMFFGRHDEMDVGLYIKNNHFHF